MEVLNTVKEYNRQFCNHEAGHYIIAMELGFQCTDIHFTIINSTTHNGKVGINLNKPLYQKEDILQYCRNRIIILNAGACAQSISSNNQIVDHLIEHCFRNNGAEDYTKIREHLRLIRNIEKTELTDQETRDYINNLDLELRNRSKELVRKYIEEIKLLGQLVLDEIKEYEIPITLRKEVILNIERIKKIQNK